MKCALLPAGDENTASTRMRVFTLARSFRKMGVDHQIGSAEGADVVFVQKKVDEALLREVRKAKLQGACIIYDIDDFGAALWYWVPKNLFGKMIELADVVTTSSEAQLTYLRETFGVSHATVWHNPVDFYPERPERPLMRARGPLKVVWFGSSSNFRMAQKYVGAITSMRDVELYAISPAGSNRVFEPDWPQVTFIDWTLDGFTSMLQSCDVSCLMHDASDADRAKSNNKMTVSITWGVPAVVSRTPAYERTAIEAGVEAFLFEDHRELVSAIERLRDPEARRLYLDTAQGPVWERYAPDVAARRFLAIAERLRRGDVQSRLWSVARSWLPSRVA